MTYVIRLISFAFGLAVLAPVAMAAEHRLGPEDRLNIRAIVWDDELRSFQQWDLLSGEYAVQSDGTISVPITGSVAAAGLTTAELSQTMSDALSQDGGMIDPPRLAIEVVRYRPFYIVGDVAHPGAYPGQPGITALQAVALAGGTGNLPENGGATLSTTLRNAGNLRDLRNEMARARVREVRLEAEIAGAETLVFPDRLHHPDGAEATARIRAEETAIFQARKAAHERELAALNELEDLLAAEVDGLERKFDGLREQMRLAQENVDNIATLAERGYAQATRLADAQRSVIDLQGKETDLQNNTYRARQRISENRRDIIELQASRETQAQVELQKVKAELEALQIRRDVLEQVIVTEGVATDALSIGAVTVRYGVVRAGSETGVPEPVGATTAIGPGDVLSVAVEISEPEGFTQ
ncbi:polysaccharide biosynthesis/export family protein [Marinibacterium sp. SX1]|uniref:polysaccharide biosynthesis/export family protein n=1 Tax=Marinibacterium sp. SX1 TaxID=3388424 RepID=UPI003D17CB45